MSNSQPPQAQPSDAFAPVKPEQAAQPLVDAHRSSLLGLFKSPAAPPPVTLARKASPKPTIVSQAPSTIPTAVPSIAQDLRPMPAKPLPSAQPAAFIPPMPPAKDRSSPSVKPRHRRQRDSDSPRRTPKIDKRVDSRPSSGQKPLPGQFRPTAILARPAQAETSPASVTPSPSVPTTGRESPERPDVHDFKRPAAREKAQQAPKPFAPQILKRPVSQDKARPVAFQIPKPAVDGPLPVASLPEKIIEARKPSESMSPEQKASLLSMFKGAEAKPAIPKQNVMPPAAAEKIPEPKTDLLTMLRSQAPKKPVEPKNVASPRPDLLSLFNSDVAKAPTPEARRASLVNLFKSDTTKAQTPEQHKANLVNMFKSAEPTPEQRKASLVSLFKGSEPEPQPSSQAQKADLLSVLQSPGRKTSFASAGRSADLFAQYRTPMQATEPAPQKKLIQCKICGQVGHNSKLCPVSLGPFIDSKPKAKQETKATAPDQKSSLLAMFSSQPSGSSTPNASQMQFGNSSSMVGQQRSMNMGLENSAAPMQLPIRRLSSDISTFNSFGQRPMGTHMGMNNTGSGTFNSFGQRQAGTNNGYNNTGFNTGLNMNMSMNNGMGAGMGRESNASPFGFPPSRPSADMQAQFQNKDAYNVDYMRMFGR